MTGLGLGIDGLRVGFGASGFLEGGEAGAGSLDAEEFLSAVDVLSGMAVEGLSFGFAVSEAGDGLAADIAGEVEEGGALDDGFPLADAPSGAGCIELGGA